MKRVWVAGAVVTCILLTFLSGVVVGARRYPPWGMLDTLYDLARSVAQMETGIDTGARENDTHLGILLSNDSKQLSFISGESKVYRNGALLTTVDTYLPDGLYVVLNGSGRTTFIINDAIHQGPASALDIWINDASKVDAMRSRLAAFIWNDDGVPYESLPSLVEQGIEDAGFRGMKGLRKIDRITISMEFGLDSIAYLFHPNSPNGRVILYHQGHSARGFIKGFHTIESFVSDGYTVVGMSMPLKGMNSRPRGIPTKYGLTNLNAHDDFTYLDGEGPSAIRFFVTPVIAVLNYLDASYSFPRYDMVGISGGGWTTIVAAALDPRITGSYPVAGSIPHPLLNEVAGDFEYSLPGLYDVANYTELYVLGASGPGREQVQIFNKFDPCCFNGVATVFYEQRVRDVLGTVGQGGAFDAVLDSTTEEHGISDFALGVIQARSEQRN